MERKMENRIYNFSAGPAILPEEYCSKLKKIFIPIKEADMCIMEMSHAVNIRSGF
jgi:phosphoserine aminotransferase